MTQLRLSTPQLRSIGFKRKVIAADKMNTRKTIYEIPCINSRFYYNCEDGLYRWYYQTTISGHSNHVHLNIKTAPELFMILSAFRVEFNLIII
jgi:hypothetical protein